MSGLTCGLECSGPLRLKMQIRAEGARGTGDPDFLTHLLLPRTVDRNHIVKVVAKNRSGEELEYRGPQPPGDIGDVEDLPLSGGLVITRDIDLRGWFDFTPDGSPYRVMVRIDGWSYETHFPHYWTGHLESNEVEVILQ